MWKTGDLTAEAEASPLLLSFPPSLRNRAGAGGGGPTEASASPADAGCGCGIQGAGCRMRDVLAKWGVLSPPALSGTAGKPPAAPYFASPAVG